MFQLVTKKAQVYNVSMNLLYAPTRSLYANIVRFFRSHGALSGDKAIEVTKLDVLEMGFPPVNDINAQLKQLDYMVKATSEGKYWLDIEAYTKKIIKDKRTFGIFFILLGCIAIASTISSTDITLVYTTAGCGLLFIVIGVFQMKAL